MAKQPGQLTPKQQMFVEEYLIDLNATQAAIRAGYSEKTAYSIGEENLRKPVIAAAINSAMEGRSKRTEITSDNVLQEIAKLAFSNVQGIFDAEGRLKPIHQLPPEIAASISSVEVVTSRVPGSDPVELEYTSKIKFWDKRGSLELLGKHLKLFTDKTEIEHSGSVEVRRIELVPFSPPQ